MGAAVAAFAVAALLLQQQQQRLAAVAGHQGETRTEALKETPETQSSTTMQCVCIGQQKLLECRMPSEPVLLGRQLATDLLLLLLLLLLVMWLLQLQQQIPLQSHTKAIQETGMLLRLLPVSLASGRATETGWDSCRVLQQLLFLERRRDSNSAYSAAARRQ